MQMRKPFAGVAMILADCAALTTSRRKKESKIFLQTQVKTNGPGSVFSGDCKVISRDQKTGPLLSFTSPGQPLA
jgi:hypothetical protein